MSLSTELKEFEVRLEVEEGDPSPTQEQVSAATESQETTVQTVRLQGAIVG